MHHGHPATSTGTGGVSTPGGCDQGARAGRWKLPAQVRGRGAASPCEGRSRGATPRPMTHDDCGQLVCPVHVYGPCRWHAWKSGPGYRTSPPWKHSSSCLRRPCQQSTVSVVEVGRGRVGSTGGRDLASAARVRARSRRSGWLPSRLARRTDSRRRSSCRREVLHSSPAERRSSNAPSLPGRSSWAISARQSTRAGMPHGPVSGRRAALRCDRSPSLVGTSD